MKRNQILWCVFYWLAFVPTLVVATDDKPLPNLKPLSDKIQILVQKHYPDAKFSFKNNKIHFEFNTMKFHIHGRMMDGEFTEKTFEEIGPQASTPQEKRGGIIGNIQIRKGAFQVGQGRAGVQQPDGSHIINRYYFNQLDMTPFDPNLKHHLVVNMSYASGISAEFKTEFKKLINSFGKHVK